MDKSLLPEQEAQLIAFLSDSNGRRQPNPQDLTVYEKVLPPMVGGYADTLIGQTLAGPGGHLYRIIEVLRNVHLTPNFQPTGSEGIRDYLVRYTRF